MTADTIHGILIPFLGTGIGSAMLFVLKKNISGRCRPSPAAGATEEKWLKNLYRQEYDDYCKRVNRNWPWKPVK